MSRLVERVGKVLLVDDEVTGRKALAQTLDRWGFDVLEASDGAAGLALLRRHRPEVVISDLYMPGHDGQYLLSEGLAESDDTAFVIVSGRAGVAEAVEVMKAGAFDFLQKPVDLRRLRSVLERAVERQRTRRELLRLRRELESAEGERTLLGPLRAHPRAARSDRAGGPHRCLGHVIVGESGTGKGSWPGRWPGASPSFGSAVRGHQLRGGTWGAPRVRVRFEDRREGGLHRERSRAGWVRL